ncbi:MAG: acetyl-CoA carboxylase biotin carboxyl carrier protein subunit [Ruminococcaceae bacterium]|nr:acetyl-CoA carboxylase biotin carboxyl carrier protein subunit [Oscillospiraceae bacterium]
MKYDVTLNGVKYTVELDDTTVRFLEKTALKNDDLIDLDIPDFDFEEENTASNIKAALPGTVIAVKASKGEEVKKGQTILVIESMKMENAIVAPEDCRIDDIHVSAGAYVSKDQKLVSFRALEVVG